MGEGAEVDWARVRTLLQEVDRPHTHNAIVERIEARYPGVGLQKRALPPRPQPTTQDPFQLAWREVREGKANTLEPALAAAIGFDRFPTPLALVATAAAERHEPEVLRRATEEALAREPSVERDASVVASELVEAVCAADLPADEKRRWSARIGHRCLSLSFPSRGVGSALVALARLGGVAELATLLEAALASDEEPVDHAGDLPSLIPFGALDEALRESRAPATEAFAKVLEAAETQTDPFVVSDLLVGLSRLPADTIRPLLKRMAERARSMEAIHRKPETLVAVANAELRSGSGGDALFALAISDAMPLNVAETLPNARAVGRAMLLVQRARGLLRVDDEEQARSLAERACELAQPAPPWLPRDFTELGLFDLAARSLVAVPTHARAMARGHIGSALDRFGEDAEVRPLVADLLAQPPPTDSAELSYALSLGRFSARASELAFEHRGVDPSDWAATRLIEALLGLPSP